MKIRYEFADGTINEIEVDDSIGEVVVAMEHEDHNSDRRETRRHTSLEFLKEEGFQFSNDTDLLADILRNEDAAMVREAVSRLKPGQRELINTLYFADKPMSHAEYAKKLGINEASVTQKAWRVRERLKQIIESMKK